MGKDRLQLLLDDLRGAVRLALLERLADAEDDGEAVVERDAGLLRDELRGLVEERAALRVACKRGSVGRSVWQSAEGIPRIT